MLSPVKVKTISRLIIDLGKILFAAFVVGFFIPGFSGKVTALSFGIGGLSSLSLLVLGVKLTK